MNLPEADEETSCHRILGVYRTIPRSDDNKGRVSAPVCLRPKPAKERRFRADFWAIDVSGKAGPSPDLGACRRPTPDHDHGGPRQAHRLGFGRTTWSLCGLCRIALRGLRRAVLVRREVSSKVAGADDGYVNPASGGDGDAGTPETNRRRVAWLISPVGTETWALTIR